MSLVCWRRLLSTRKLLAPDGWRRLGPLVAITPQFNSVLLFCVVGVNVGKKKEKLKSLDFGVDLDHWEQSLQVC